MSHSLPGHGFDSDSCYKEFAIHTPLVGRWPGWNLVALSNASPIFKVRLGNRAHKIEINNEVWRLTGRIVEHDKASFCIAGPAPCASFSQTRRRAFDFRVECAGQQFYLSVVENRRALCDSEGKLLACLSNSWKDGDLHKNIKFWIHHQQGVAPLLLAMFFCLAEGFNYDSEEGL